MKLEMLIMKGIFRRHKETGKLIVVTMFSVFFMAAILLFQKNIHSYGMQNHKQIFGDWILMEQASEGVNENLLEHPYIGGFGTTRILGHLYDETYNRLEQEIGCFDEAFIKLGNISLYQGSFPSADNEIALDLNTLTELGYKIELGQTIKVYYIDKSANASSKEEDNKLQKEYILTGIFRSYRSLWNGGDSIPGLIISENAFEQFGFVRLSRNIYSLKSNIKTEDYRLVYEGLKERARGTATYNTNLYDNQLWDSASTYNLVLYLIMGLGLTSITFQMMIYASKRKPYYYKLRGMGASKHQVRQIITIECLLCTISAAVLGILLSVMVGWGLCKSIAKRNGISQFFMIEHNLLIQVMSLTILLLIVSVIIVQILSGASRVSDNSVELTSRKLHIIRHMKLKCENIITQFIERRIYTRVIQSIFSRILIAGTCLMLIICAIQIYNPYFKFKESNKIPDFEGVLLEKPDPYSNIVTRFVEESDDEGNVIIRKEWINLSQTKYGIISGRSNSILGFDESFINTIEKEIGKSTIKYSSMESTRSIIQNSINDYNKFFQKILSTFSERSIFDFENRSNRKESYIYVSHYDTLTKDQYKRFQEDIPEHLYNYEDYKKGNQVILFLNSFDFGNGEEYDNEINPGDSLFYNYLGEYMHRGYVPYYNAFEEVRKANAYYEEDLDFDIELDKLISNVFKELSNGECDAPTVAAVIKLTSENQKNFEYLIPQQGIYTVLASEQFGRNLVEREHNTVSELVDDPDCSYKYNRIQINLDLNSEYEGTASVISQLFSKYGISYTGHYEEKQLARQNLLDAISLYGSAFVAILLVFLIIKSNMHQAELENQRRRFKLLKNLGADNKTVISIIIVGFLRENIWVFVGVAIAVLLLKTTVPLMLSIMISLIVFLLLLIVETLLSLVYVSGIKK